MEEKFRTTLLRDAGEWYVLELCEPLETLIDPSAEIYGYEGSRDLITIITDGEKDPLVMGFKLASDEPLVPAERDEHAMGEIDVAPEDEIVGVDIDGTLMRKERRSHSKVVWLLCRAPPTR